MDSGLDVGFPATTAEARRPAQRTSGNRPIQQRERPPPTRSHPGEPGVRSRCAGYPLTAARRRRDQRHPHGHSWPSTPGRRRLATARRSASSAASCARRRRPGDPSGACTPLRPTGRAPVFNESFANRDPRRARTARVAAPRRRPSSFPTDSAAECCHALHGVGDELTANDLAVTQSHKVQIT